MHESYNIFTIKFSQLVETIDTLSFTYTGIDNIILEEPVYVAGRCSFILVNQESGIGKPLTWQWQTEIVQNNVKAYLTGTINTAGGTLITPAILWNAILNEQQRTLCSVTLKATSDEDEELGVLYAVGKTVELESKLYLYILD